MLGLEKLEFGAYAGKPSSSRIKNTKPPMLMIEPAYSNTNQQRRFFRLPFGLVVDDIFYLSAEYIVRISGVN